MAGARVSRETNHAVRTRELLCDADLGSHELAPKTVITGRSQADAIALELIERARDIDFGDNTHVLIAGDPA